MTFRANVKATVASRPPRTAILNEGRETDLKLCKRSVHSSAPGPRNPEEMPWARTSNPGSDRERLDS
jgi:hypothetical protein